MRLLIEPCVEDVQNKQGGFIQEMYLLTFLHNAIPQVLSAFGEPLQSVTDYLLY